jgi:hypothetical protein
MSVDPELAETDQPYAYAGDDPLNTQDPAGLDTGDSSNSIDQADLEQAIAGLASANGANCALYVSEEGPPLWGVMRNHGAGCGGLGLPIDDEGVLTFAPRTVGSAAAELACGPGLCFIFGIAPASFETDSTGSNCEATSGYIFTQTDPKGGGVFIVGAVAGSDNTSGGQSVSLYRAVGQNELADIQDFGGLRGEPSGRSYLGKLFATTAEDAEAYGRLIYSGANEQAFTLVRADVPENYASRLESLDTMPDGYRTIPVAEDELSELSAVSTISILDTFSPGGEGDGGEDDGGGGGDG